MFAISMLISFGASLLAILYGLVLSLKLLKQPVGNKKMADISRLIQEGAKVYLNKQYGIVSVVVAVIFVVLLYSFSFNVALAFLIGAIFSSLAGYIGMNISVKANVRTAEAAKDGLSAGLKTAFRAGTITGLMVVGLGLLVVTGLYAIFKDVEVLIGLGFGGSLISIFARLGGGIFTKGADVGADMVGKIEANIPEDDLRNPAVIADNVGDNVGDCAGTAADIFETYVVAIVASMLLGRLLFPNFENAVLLPLVLSAASIITFIVGSCFVRLGKNSVNVMAAFYRGLIVTGVLSAAAFYFVSEWLMKGNGSWSTLNIFFSTIIGLIVTAAMVLITEYFTSHKFSPVREIIESSITGSGTNIITGLAVSMRSTCLPILVIGASILGAYSLSGLYGVAIAATAMLSLAGIVMAIDAIGPIVDNAGGIAEMATMQPEVRACTDTLDAVGNTTKAITKGYAIGAAGLAAIVLFAEFTKSISQAGNALNFDLKDPYVLIGLLLGGVLSYYFSSLAMEAVGKAGNAVAKEVRRQFESSKGILSGAIRPDYKAAVEIVTKAAIREMIFPAIVTVLTPVLIGFILGPVALGGFLIGVILTGLFLAISMTSGGGAWDNAKKFIEDGHNGGRGSTAHLASITGDTVGDPYKDTAGPSINPVIKVVNIVAILIAPTIISVNLSFVWKIIIVGVLVIAAAAYVIFGKKVVLKRKIK